MNGPAAAPRGDLWQAFGDWLLRRQTWIRRTQWTIVCLYLALLVIPAFLPLPDRQAYIWTNFTRFAQFLFWGIWWPFVLLSIVLVGRMWCGLLCPEGSISEFASRHGRGGAIPRWMKWPGWPTSAFVFTTIYGQLTSVYQYPKPALAVLGGSTVAAAVIGYLYGKNKRVWCRYLCPVSGVFALLAKLAPLHFQVDPDMWVKSQRSRVKPAPVNCAPLVPLRTMRGSSNCHMCGRCSGFRGAIRLSRRSPNHEIVHVAGETANSWESMLILFGLMGVAAGAFHWTASPWFVSVKLQIAGWFVNGDGTWMLENSAPWWLLTNYPEKNDVLTLLDGTLVVGYILATAIAIGLLIGLCLVASNRCLGPWNTARFHHLVQSLIPLAAGGAFLGLSSMTVSQLHMDGMEIPFVSETRAAILALSTVWSMILHWQVAGRYVGGAMRRTLAGSCVLPALITVDAGWSLFFWVW